MDHTRRPGQPLAGSPAWFSDFTQLPTRLPPRVWDGLRALAVLAVLGQLVLLGLRPALGLTLFWGVTVPLLPLIFWWAPGLWRNVCPLATVNQLPRRLGLQARGERPSFPARWAYPLAMASLIVLVSTRKFLFNASAPATGLLLGAALALAALGGWWFKGKSGWCSSICPLQPVQRLYGQAPLLLVAQTQCTPCVGCTRHCMDFRPGAAHLAEHHDDEDPTARHHRRLFAGLWPGLVAGYYLVPDAPALPAYAIAMKMTAWMAVSYTAFQVLDHALGRSRNLLPALFAALAIVLYYGFGASGWVHQLQGLGLPLPGWTAHGLQGLVGAVALVWFVRALRIERGFLAQRAPAARAAGRAGVPVQPVPLHRPRVTPSPSHPAGGGAATGLELQLEPDGRCMPWPIGQTLLEALGREGLAMEASCRAGLCGADPVTVLEGATCLNLPGPDEAATLQRLGLPTGVRLACAARRQVEGRLRVRLGTGPGLAAPDAASPPADTGHPQADPRVRRVVIVGNGVAGVTVAEELRRLSPDCEIHLIGRETRPAYNRMAIARLIPKGMGVHGLLLQSGDWYAAQRITTWLNTQAVRIQRKKRRLVLATGESLAYDRLILATGASAWVPPIRHAQAPGCFVLRDADDAMAIRAHAQRQGARRALIVGAGLLGLEAAQALRELGLGVTVLSHIDLLLDQQIDAQASVLVAQALQRLGIGLAFQAAAQSLDLDGRGHVTGLRAADGRAWPAELVVVCAGTRANTELARAAGLRLGAFGVVVDAGLRTSDPSILAVGDVAEFAQERHGLWAVAVEQARLAAAQAMGVPHRAYTGHVPVTRLKVSGVHVASAGRIQPSPEAEVRVQRDDPSGAYRKLVIEQGRVVGAVLIGPWAHTETVLDAVRRQAPADELPEGAACSGASEGTAA